MSGPIDPKAGLAFVLEGRVVTMDEALTVHERGRIYVNGGLIAAITDAAAPPPDGFPAAAPIKVEGTVYPGLIELHNHLSYDILPLWQVPELFTNRDTWQRRPAYHQLVSGPMKVIAATPGLVAALVRYVEAKCLVAGTTTSQGVMLSSFNGISTYYAGIVRNVERTGDNELPISTGHIADVAATDAEAFLNRLSGTTRYLLHLSEGTDAAARKHFADLKIAPNKWAITPHLGGIHCVALSAEDFAILEANGGSMVWSPLSNLLLYGQTAKVAAAKQAGVVIGIGSDWSPSGSRNVLSELKIARLVSAQQDGGAVFSDSELIALATRNAARILGWEKALGSLEPGKRADLLVIAGSDGDPYGHLLAADEGEVSLVVIGGAARYGRKRLMEHLAPQPRAALENVTIARGERLLDLRQATEFPAVAALTLAAARGKLADGLEHLPELAKELEHKPVAALLAPDPDQLFLVLDHDEPPLSAIRPHFSAAAGGRTADVGAALAASKPLSEIVQPTTLDPLTVVDDPGYAASLRTQRNLPDYIKQGLG